LKKGNPLSNTNKPSAKKKLSFLKVSRRSGNLPLLDPVVVARNKAKGIETTLLLDTNVLIYMETAVKNGNSWGDLKALGLDKLVKLLGRCPPQSVCLSPGCAFNEMPPGLADASRSDFEAFLAKHLPSFTDTPNSTRNAYAGKTRDFGFEDLSEEHQAVLAASFTSLLLMLLVEYRSGAAPIDKFQLLLERLVTTLDLLSLKEVEIARYVFAPDGKQGTPTQDSITVLRRNFAKTKAKKAPRTADELLKVAFNGACDLHLINAAVSMDNRGLDNVPQDTWITTFDDKLADFCSIFHYLDDGEHTGALGVMNLNAEQAGAAYWEESLRLRKNLIAGRLALDRTVDLDHLRTAAHQVIAEVRQQFPS